MLDLPSYCVDHCSMLLNNSMGFNTTLWNIPKNGTSNCKGPNSTQVILTRCFFIISLTSSCVCNPHYEHKKRHNHLCEWKAAVACYVCTCNYHSLTLLKCLDISDWDTSGKEILISSRKAKGKVLPLSQSSEQEWTLTASPPLPGPCYLSHGPLHIWRGSGEKHIRCGRQHSIYRKY